MEIEKKRKEIENIIKKEGDYKEFKHMGYKCVILRHPHLKHLCGYVGVPKDHILYGVDHDDLPAEFHDVHGGLTFSGFRKEYTNDDLWYFGFDCAHAGDLVPAVFSTCNGTYRTMEYVEKECKKLAEKIAEFTKFANKVLCVLELVLKRRKV